MATTSNLTTEQLYQYKLSFQVKLGHVHGTGFQDFFSTVLERTHGADFIRVRAFGSLGDKGCDGYLKSSGQVFQCYGKEKDAAPNSKMIVNKVNGDYNLAALNLKSIMKEWHFGHNLQSGVATDLVLAVDELEKANPELAFGLIGPAALEKLALALPLVDLIDLLGPAATAEDNRNLNMAEVAALMKEVIQAIDEATPSDDPVKPVPLDKLQFNKLPTHWCGLIRGGIRNAQYVEEFFNLDRDPEVGSKIASAFHTRYRELRLEGLEPGAIMDKLYEGITGVGSVTTQRQVAAHALLAHLFESCDIFERPVSEIA